MNFPKAETTTRLVARKDDRSHYTLPSWGFIEEIELRPRVELPNMDVTAPYKLICDLIGPDGERVPLDIQIVARDVK